jgi:hypothetical protein
MAKTNPVDPSVPAGTEDPNLGDNRIRNLAAAVAELLGIDHYMGTDGGAGTGYNDDAAGEHRVITLRAESDPVSESGKCHIYGKTVSGVVEFFFKDKDGNVLQLTTGGVFNAALLNSKTISALTLTSPVLNTQVTGTAVLDEDNMSSDSALKLATQQSIKAYIDAKIAAIGSLFGTWASKANNTAYEAATDGTVHAYSALMAHAAVIGYTDGNNPPTTVRTRSYIQLGASNPCYANLTMDVRKGDYWKVTGASVVWWLPKGA